MKAKLLYTCNDITGEAATWLPDTETFLWVNIEGCILHEYNPATGSHIQHELPDMVSTIIPFRKNEVVLALKGKLVHYLLKEKAYTVLTEIEPGNIMLRPNDGKASPEGRIWLGVMHLDNHNETGSLCCIDHDLSIRKVLTNQCIPNGIVWNSQGDTMYYADSGRKCIEEYSYNKQTGEISFVRTAIQVPDGYGVPDGMAIDASNNLWVAHWGGYGVYVWNPRNGKLIDKVEVPVPNVASCTFGDKYQKKLFITTALAGLSDTEKKLYPESGSLFVTDCEVPAGKNHYSFIINS